MGRPWSCGRIGGGDDSGRYEYELRSQYQGDLIENGEVATWEHEEGYDKIKITFQTKLQELQEYVLVLRMMEDEEVLVRYYTRVVVENDFHAKHLLTFVEQFHHAIFDKAEAERIITKSIEPNEDGNNDYHSSFHTITFAKLNPSRMTKPIPSIKEIDDSYAIIQLKYLITAEENKTIGTYYVTEDYRVRYDNEADSVYLLDYNRSQEALFSINNVDTVAGTFKLGILRDDDFCYVTSDKQKKIAFAQARQLWYYDYDRGTIANVYGFCQGDNYTDIRVTYDENDIRVLKMDDDGNLVFAVYGYMNRGQHEGKVGISVYKFTASKDKMEEVLFIENNKPYHILKEDMEKLLYLSEEGEFYYFDNDCVVKVDTETLKSEVFIEDVLNAHLAVSEDNHLIGYPDQLLTEYTNKVTILNLETKESREIVADSQERLQTIGFVEEDLILGKVKESDIEIALDKTVTCPISSIDIIDADNKVIKSYGTEGVFVVDAKAKDGVVYLERAYKRNGKFEPAPQDFITYKEDENGNKVDVVYRYNDNSYNQLYLNFPDYMYVTSKPRLMITKEAVREKDITVKITFDHVNSKYYAYGQGKYMANYLSLNAAVREAFENAGVVIDENGVILWRKITVKEYHTVADKIKLYHVTKTSDTLAACIYMMGVYEERIRNTLPCRRISRVKYRWKILYRNM